MIVDLHFHLEEGPYTFKWLTQTMKSLAAAHTPMQNLSPYTPSWAKLLGGLLGARLKQGCYTQEWLEHYLRAGRRRGVEVFGVVDHLYRFRECKSYYEKHIITDDSPLGELQRDWLEQVCIASLEDYVSFIQQMKRQYPELLLGIEADYFAGGEEELSELLNMAAWDYTIGSVHFVNGWGFDNPATQDRFEKMEHFSSYQQLFSQVQAAARSGLFDIIAHPDNLKAFGFRPSDETLLMPLYEETARILAQSGVATEINTGLSYRYPVAEACPSPLFLKVLSLHKVPITLSSDAHFPEHTGYLLPEARDMARVAGYTEIVTFKERKRISVPL